MPYSEGAEQLRHRVPLRPGPSALLGRAAVLAASGLGKAGAARRGRRLVLQALLVLWCSELRGHLHLAAGDERLARRLFEATAR